MTEKKKVKKIKRDKHGNIKKEKDSKFKKKILKKVAGKPIFKTVDKFNPSAIPVRVFKKELNAQYRKFEDNLGFDPDHLSCHFPVIFMAPKFFKEVCALSKNERLSLIHI